ncbi:poly(A)-specific ribonuclease [Theileria orientalis]|uniref:Poly(A)-specific ribonuclease n=1 Tax=Theileria orientalis TaxID=68886 RepID=A0A976MEI5_THEOR|nr:poly(A)-specific ribonuclease [Theileria orientalis]
MKKNRSFIGYNSLQSYNFTTNVTSKLNWDNHCRLIVDLIKESDFVALDVEYTGLHIKDERFIGVDKCYESHVSGAKKFIPCQIGLTMAKFDRGTWKVTPASLFTIPPDGNIFSVNMSTLNFLKDNNFDFNNWIRHGICHLKPKEEEERKSLILSKLAHIDELTRGIDAENQEFKVNEYDLTNIQDLEDRKTVEDVVKRVEFWLFSNDKKPLEFEVESAFLRLLIHSVISIKFPNIYSNSCKKDDKKVVRVYKSQLELLESDRATLSSELSEIDREVGLRILFDTISRHKKIMVGHNCFYDILHVYQTFYGDLPDTVESFKTEWLKVFPKVFDTKYISEFFHILNPQSSLKMLYESVLSNSTCRIDLETLPGTKWDITLPGSKRSVIDNISDDGAEDSIVKKFDEHDAGYDSFMTGLVFIHQLEEVIKSKNATLSNLVSTVNSRDNSSTNRTNKTKTVPMVIDRVFSEVANSVRLVKCQPSVLNMETQEDMSRHFYMFGFPNSWKKWEIMKIWSPLWVSVSWIDESSCWVVARNQEDVKNINLIYKMMKNPQFKLYNYGQYVERVRNNTTVVES